jgi:hypothetical protein
LIDAKIIYGSDNEGAGNGDMDMDRESQLRYGSYSQRGRSRRMYTTISRVRWLLTWLGEWGPMRSDKMKNNMMDDEWE